MDSLYIKEGFRLRIRFADSMVGEEKKVGNEEGKGNASKNRTGQK